MKIYLVMISIPPLLRNQISALNKSLGVDMPLNEIIKPVKYNVTIFLRGNWIEENLDVCLTLL